MGVNRVCLSGRLTRDPELRATQGGTQVLGFSLAVGSRRRNPDTGAWEDRADFVGCVMFGNRAESVSRYLAKGAKVAVEGRLRYHAWERDGERRSRLEVVVDEIDLMGQPAAAREPREDAPAVPADVPGAVPPAGAYDEDVPF